MNSAPNTGQECNLGRAIALKESNETLSNRSHPSGLLVLGAGAPNTVNLSTQPWSYSIAYSFPAGSNYAPYYGTGIGLVYTESYGQTGWNYIETWGGSTIGNITHFANAYAYIPDFSGTFSNATFNSKTDVLSGMFVGSEYINGKWMAFSGHITDTLNLNGYPGGYSNGGWNYTYTTGGVSSAYISSVPEPSSLTFLGTGLVGIAGVIKRKLTA